jgi:photoactive yellow protein
MGLASPVPGIALGFRVRSLLGALEMAEPEALDAAPFGIIGLGRDGAVSVYNRFESRLTGFNPERVLGRHFFTEVAPCTNSEVIAGRFHELDSLDETVDFVFGLRVQPLRVRLRLLKSVAYPRHYILVEPRD